MIVIDSVQVHYYNFRHGSHQMILIKGVHRTFVDVQIPKVCQTFASTENPYNLIKGISEVIYVSSNFSAHLLA